MENQVDEKNIKIQKKTSEKTHFCPEKNKVNKLRSSKFLFEMADYMSEEEQSLPVLNKWKKPVNISGQIVTCEI